MKRLTRIRAALRRLQARAHRHLGAQIAELHDAVRQERARREWLETERAMLTARPFGGPVREISLRDATARYAAAAALARGDRFLRAESRHDDRSRRRRRCVKRLKSTSVAISVAHNREIKPRLLEHVERVRRAAHAAAMEGRSPRRKPPRRPLIQKV